MPPKPPPSLFAPPKRQASARVNSLLWVFDPLEREAGYVSRKMFGCEAACLDGLQYLVVAERGEPWNGLLLCTDRVHHAALIADMPALRPHPVLGKWLYVPQDDAAFETAAAWAVGLVLARDARLGVASGTRRRTKRG